MLNKVPKGDRFLISISFSWYEKKYLIILCGSKERNKDSRLIRLADCYSRYVCQKLLKVNEYVN